MADYQLSYTGDQVNTAIGQIVDKNITGTLTVETLALANPLAITQGGTGKDNRIDAFSNLADYGSVTESVANDIPGVWGEKGSGVHSFIQSSGGGGGSIESMYSGSTIYNWVTYRYIAGQLSPDTVTQFRIINGGSCYTRFGYARQSDWSTPWTLATESIQIKKVWENASPTSSFSEQTLTISTLSSYDWYVIIYKFHTTLNYALAEFGVVGNGTIINMVDAGSIYRRNVDCSANNLTISEMNGFRVSNAANISDNNYLIPVMIYGVKGVI